MGLPIRHSISDQNISQRWWKIETLPGPNLINDFQSSGYSNSEINQTEWLKIAAWLLSHSDWLEPLL